MRAPPGAGRWGAAEVAWVLRGGAGDGLMVAGQTPPRLETERLQFAREIASVPTRMDELARLGSSEERTTAIALRERGERLANAWGRLVLGDAAAGEGAATGAVAAEAETLADELLYVGLPAAMERVALGKYEAEQFTGPLMRCPARRRPAGSAGCLRLPGSARGQFFFGFDRSDGTSGR